MKAVFLLPLAATAAIASPRYIDFGYEGSSGPRFWPGKCQNTGPGQSPIDLREGYAVEHLDSLPVASFALKSYNLVNSGVGLRLTDDFSPNKSWFVPYGEDTNFVIEDLHIHSPSEHHINGVYFDAEMHMFARNGDERRSVLAVLFEISDSPQEGNLLSQMAKHLPLNRETVSLPGFDLDSLRLATNNFTGLYSYNGSLTMPPCTENVLWNVMRTPVKISLSDALALRYEIGYTARFTQVARDLEAPSESSSSSYFQALRDWLYSAFHGGR